MSLSSAARHVAQVFSGTNTHLLQQLVEMGGELAAENTM
jgi:hypothetical protein